MKQKRLSGLSAFVMLTLTFILLGGANLYAVDHKTVRGGQILNCYGWTYNQIKDQLTAIKDANFTAVQVSSAQPLLPKETKEVWRGLSTIKDITVYCKKTSSDPVYLWAWGDDVDLGVGWPGIQMKKVKNIGGQDFWYETIKTTASLGLILNDGNGKQSTDLSTTQDTFYEFDTESSYEDKGNTRYTCTVLSGYTSPQKDITIYSKHSEKTLIHAWNADGDLPGEPGIVMTKKYKLDEVEYYYETYKENSINFQFRDEYGTKTDNIENVTNDRAYETSYTYTGITVNDLEAPSGKNTTAEKTITIYCRSSVEPRIHAWNSKGDLTNSDTKGDAMDGTVTINGVNYYYKTFNTDKLNGYLFTYGGVWDYQSNNMPATTEDVRCVYNKDKKTATEVKDITLYINHIGTQNEKKVYLHVWDTEGAYDTNLGVNEIEMTETVDIEGTKFWKKTFYGVPKVSYIAKEYTGNTDYKTGEQTTDHTVYRKFYNHNTIEDVNVVTRTLYIKSDVAPFLHIWGTNTSDDTGDGNNCPQLNEKVEINGVNYWKKTFQKAQLVNFLIKNKKDWVDHSQTGNFSFNNETELYLIYDGASTATYTRPDVEILVKKMGTKPYLYAYDTGGELNGGWPGSNAWEEKYVNGIPYYFKSFTGKSSATIILNDGQGGVPDHQTGNIDVTNGQHIYQFYQRDVAASIALNNGTYLYCKTSDGTAPWLYTFNGVDRGDWPGQQLTKSVLINGETWWYEQFDTNTFTAVFNNGNNGVQTDDIHIDGTKFVTLDMSNGDKNSNTTYPDVAEPEEVTIFVKKESSAPYLYMTRTSSRLKQTGDKPGVQMSKVTNINGDDYYYMTFKGTDFYYIISDGKGHESSEYTAVTANRFHSAVISKTVSTTEQDLSNITTYAPTWAFFYEPLGFRLADNMLGTVAEFKALVNAAHEAGIGVVVGIEANSVSNKTDKLDANVKSYLRNYTGTEDWTRRDRQWITHHNVNVYDGSEGDYVVDLKTEDTGFQTIVKNYLKELADAGVDGFCFYHAKYIGLEKGASYTNEDEGLGASPYPGVVEGDTFWTKITDYIYKEGDHKTDGLALWAYAEIGVDPYYKAGGTGQDDNHMYYANEDLSNPSNDKGRHRLVREYRNALDINDAYYTRMLIKDGGVNTGSTGYWEQKIIEEKLHQGKSVSEILAGRRVASKSDLVISNEYPDTYFEIQPEMYGPVAKELLGSFRPDNAPDRNNLDPKKAEKGAQAWMDRAYARLAGQDGATIVYFSRPGSQTAEMGAASLTEEQLHFKGNKLITELNKYHTLMSGMKESVADVWDGSVSQNYTAIARADGAVVIQRYPNGNDAVSVENSQEIMEANTYMDHISNTNWTVTKDNISGTLDADGTGVAVLYDEDAVKYRYFTVEPNSYTAPYSVIFSKGKIKIKSTGAYPLRFWLSNNANFSQSTSYWGNTTGTNYRTNLIDVAAGEEYEYEITSEEFAKEKKYRTMVYLRVYIYYNNKYYNQKEYQFEVREESYKKEGDNSIFHVLYFKVPEDPAFDLSKLTVYAFSDQFGEAIDLTPKTGLTFPTSKDNSDGSWYRPVDLVYDGVNFGTDTSYSDFVGNNPDTYNPYKGASYCDYAGYPKVDSEDKYYRMTIGVPNLNFDIVKVVCSYNGNKLQQWTVDDDAFFNVEMKDGQVYVAPIRSIAGPALYDSKELSKTGKRIIMNFEPNITKDAQGNSEKVWSYTGQFVQGQPFRLLAPVDYQQNFMQGNGYTTTYGTDGEKLFTQPLEMLETVHGVSLGGTSAAEGGLTYKSDYTQTQGYYLAENSSANGNTDDELTQQPSQATAAISYSVNLTGAYDPQFVLPTGTYRLELHERSITTENNSTTDYYYTLSKPTVSVVNTNGNEGERYKMTLEQDLTGWNIKGLEIGVNKGNQFLIRDVDDESVFTPVRHQIDKRDADVEQTLRGRNYSESGHYRVKHIMGYKDEDGNEVASKDKFYLGFKTAKIEGAKDNDGQNLSGYWSSFSSGKIREIPDDVTAYTISTYEVNTAKPGEAAYKNGSFILGLKQVTGTVPAETPLLIYYPDKVNNFNFDYDNDYDGENLVFLAEGTQADVDASPAIGQNYLKPQVAINTESTYENLQHPNTQYPDCVNYMLSYQRAERANNEFAFGFFWVPSTISAAADYRKAFLSIPKNAPLSPVAPFDVKWNFSDGELTGIDAVDSTTEDTAPWYNLQGIRVEHPTKGVYIHNGKKVVIK